MSSTIDFVPFHPGHVLLIDRTGSDAGWISNPVESFAKQAAAGTAITMLVNGRIAGSAGIARLWPGLGEVWMLPTDLARQHPLTLTKAAKRFIATAMGSLALRRAQCFCKTADQRAVRWANALGFTREGTLRRYGADGSDYEVMAIVR